MALPKQLKSARMTNSTLGVDIDNKVAEIESALCDILGFTLDTDVTESPLSCDNSGHITKQYLLLKPGAIAGGIRIRTSDNKEVLLCLNNNVFIIYENTGSEGTPVWTVRSYMDLDTGIWHFTAIPTGPDLDPSTPYQFTRKQYVDNLFTGFGGTYEALAHKGAASGYCPLDAGSKVPTTNLGGAGADNTKFLRGDQTWQTVANKIAGDVVQVVSTASGAAITDGTQIPIDDSIPQNSEGFEVMTRAITPGSASNLLKVEAVVYCGANGGTGLTAALFKDSDADALTAGASCTNSANYVTNIKLTYWMTAGTTSPITFKVRMGRCDSGTATFNGCNGGRMFGGACLSSITVTEYKV